MKPFDEERREIIAALGADPELAELSRRWLKRAAELRYCYTFSWLGRPVIQYPGDLLALQEIVWRVKPDLVIETGVAHGGSLVFYASLLELLGGDGRVLGIDIDIRTHNREAIENHPLAQRIDLIQGSSTAPDVLRRVAAVTEGKRRVMVVLDSNHTYEHVRQELALYSPFVSKDSYLVVLDTYIDDLPQDFFSERPWNPGNSPRTALNEFLAQCDRFEIDRELRDKLLLTVSPDGFLRCVK